MKVKYLNTSGRPPSPRWFHTATLIGTKMYVFGGSTSQQYLNDLHTFDIETEQWEQVCFGPGQVQPSPRHLHAACQYNNKLIIFGGSNSTYSNDLFEYDPDRREWCAIPAHGQIPPPRQAHSMVVWKDEFVVFGGINDSEVLNDIHIFNYHTKTWRRVDSASGRGSEEEFITNSDEESIDMSPHGNTSSFWDSFDENDEICFDDMIEQYEKAQQSMQMKTPPSQQGRRSHCAVCDSRGRMWVFGGFTSTSYASGMSYFDLDSCQWVSIEIKNHHAPFPRSSMQSALISPHLFVVYGGTDCKGLKNDIWVFDTELIRWYKVLSTKTGTCTGHQLCSAGSNVFVSPGYNGSSWSNRVFSFEMTGL